MYFTTAIINNITFAKETVSFFLHLLRSTPTAQTLLKYLFLILAFLTGVRSNLKVI